MVETRLRSSRHLSRLLFLALVVVLVWRISVNIRHSLLDRQLIAAVQDQNLSRVARLLGQGADPLTKDSGNGKGTNQRTALQLAINATAPNARRLFDLLLDHTGQVNPCGDDGAEVLHAVIEQGRNDVVRRLLDHGANINAIDARNRGGFTLLHSALLGGHIDTVRLLLDRGADTRDLKNGSLFGALIYGNSQAFSQMLRLLVDRGLDVNATHDDGRAWLLDVAARRGDDIATVRLLLQHGANVNARIPMYDSTSLGNVAGASALRMAIGSGNFGIARLLIDSGADVNAADYQGVTPLMMAIEMAAIEINNNWILNEPLPPSDRPKPRDAHTRGEMKRKMTKAFQNLVRDFLAHGAKVNAMDRSGQTALIFALAYSQPDIAHLLLEHSASVNVLAAAATMVPPAGLRFLLDRGARMDATDPTGSTALINAVNIGDLDSAALLLTRGAQVDAPNAASNTALMSVILRTEHFKALGDLIRLLLTHGANVNARNRDGTTALMLTAQAVKCGPDIVQLLLDHGADLRAEDNRGKNALFYAAENGQTDHLKLLLGKGVNINSRDRKGETPLIAMLRSTTLLNQTLALALANGADVNARDADGQTPLMVALQHRHSRAVEQLRHAGARE